jgi:AcrR family transcriptional regulator
VTEAIHRPLRADARRNHQAVLESAEVLFAVHGSKVRLEDVARHAGVGVGTVYRHFPTKEALVDAVLVGMHQSLLHDVDKALADPDPGPAFAAFLSNIAELHARHRVLAEQMSNNEIELSPASSLMRDQFRARVADLVARAQSCGAIRSDVGPSDIALLLIGITAAISPDLEPTLRQRYLTIVLDGLRTSDPTPLPGQPLDLDDLARVKRAARRGR